MGICGQPYGSAAQPAICDEVRKWRYDKYRTHFVAGICLRKVVNEVWMVTLPLALAWLLQFMLIKQTDKLPNVWIP